MLLMANIEMRVILGEAQDLQPCVKNDREEGDTEDVEELEEAEEPHCERGQ